MSSTSFTYHGNGNVLTEVDENVWATFSKVARTPNDNQNRITSQYLNGMVTNTRTPPPAK